MATKDETMTSQPYSKPGMGEKIAGGAKATAGKVGDGAKTVGKTVKDHPIKTAAAVGGVAAAAAGAVIGKKYYDKRQEQNAGRDEAREAVKKAVAKEQGTAPKVEPKTN